MTRGLGSGGRHEEAVALPPAAPTSLPCPLEVFGELSREFLRAGKCLRFRARGASMSPLVRDGDVLLVRPAGASLLRLGDVVLCSRGPGQVVVHRVVGRRREPDGPYFRVQGDQVARPDGWIPAAEVYGRVVAIERGVGVRMDLDRPLVRWLGRLAVLRSRWQIGRGRGARPARWLVRRLPGLSRYLA